MAATSRRCGDLPPAAAADRRRGRGDHRAHRPPYRAHPRPPRRRPRRRRRARRRCAFVDGFSLHADTVVAAADRAGLERLARYLLRPAISADRVAVRPDGRVEVRFRRPDPTGRTVWVTDGPTPCRRLATLIPPRRSHVVRYHGVFASAHRLRDRVVPMPPDDAAASPVTASMLARRLDWAALLERVFGADVTTFEPCVLVLERVRSGRFDHDS